MGGPRGTDEEAGGAPDGDPWAALHFEVGGLSAAQAAFLQGDQPPVTRADDLGPRPAWDRPADDEEPEPGQPGGGDAGPGSG